MKKPSKNTQNMGRPKTLNGSNPIVTTLDDATFAELEAARGKIPRSTFVRDVLAARLHVLNAENPCEVARDGVFGGVIGISTPIN